MLRFPPNHGAIALIFTLPLPRLPSPDPASGRLPGARQAVRWQRPPAVRGRRFLPNRVLVSSVGSLLSLAPVRRLVVDVHRAIGDEPQAAQSLQWLLVAASLGVVDLRVDD